ncbi:polar amino acid transport system substrate-binding protein [Inhella inkyongensis]|uniref:Polar amino acid transport system substrate-binding protein n=1 Tax=Inhella inkyongensis TaxID=392593 RepID=A0A840S4F9_9BURK|nr:transporter substrate-binding domain-containing protein [Inhella inkyongensis]MBB5203420.1 polar amino acid transport system substrate-binding protein [Inhella inkyongensis]
MSCLRWFGAILLLMAMGAQAAGPGLVVSTNNTPIDRKALDLLAREAFRRVGLEFKLVSNPSERSLVMANEGEVDGEGLRIAGLSTQYPNLVQVPERFVGVSFVAFSKGTQIKVDQGWDSLKPHRVAFITGWKLYEANATGAKSVMRLEKPEQLFKMLDAGRVDLVLYTRADGSALVRGLNLQDIVPLTPALKEVDMYLYLNKKHEAWVQKIAQALREMKADGSYSRIMTDVMAD